MTDGPTGSTVPRRQLGRYLRELRNEARMTVRSAARALERSEATIWRVETGQTSLRALDVQAMCQVYGAPADLTKALMGLAKETKSRGWWHSYGDVVPDRFHLYVGLEEAASRIDWYEPELVPGLLQTEDYAREVIRVGNADITQDEVERRVTFRMARQSLLTRPTDPPSLRVVINEAVLRRPVAGERSMAEQLRHLVQMTRLRNVEIRVAPFSAGLHYGALTGQFVLLRFPVTGEGKDTEPPTVNSDGFTGDLYLDKPNEVASYDRAFDHMWKGALVEDETRHMIDKLARKHDNQAT